jgi:putative membrane protein
MAARRPRRPPYRHRYGFVIALATAYLLLFLACAIRPADRQVWMLENALAVAFVIGLAATARPFPFSHVSYAMIFAFLCLHTLGAHYTYSQVPYDRWLEAITGRTAAALFGWERNHFDRIVHFAYGLLLAYPIREIFLRIASAKGFWGYLLPLLATMSTSMIYEMIEWWAAIVFGEGVGMTYLGTQGDEWDAHKDMALATLGATIAMGVTAASNLIIQRDFAREWNESLRVKRRRPLGEVAIQDALEDKAKANPLPPGERAG